MNVGRVLTLYIWFHQATSETLENMDRENQTIVTEFYYSDFPHLRKVVSYSSFLCSLFMCSLLLEISWSYLLSNWIHIFTIPCIISSVSSSWRFGIPEWPSQRCSPTLSVKRILFLSLAAFCRCSFSTHLGSQKACSSQWWSLTGMMPSASLPTMQPLWPLNYASSSPPALASLAFLCYCQRMCGFLPFPSVVSTKSINSSVTLNLCYAWPVQTHPWCVEDVIHAISILISVCIITLSYLRIITVILRIPSGKSRQKAFSTCAAHITIFFLFFGSVTLMYLSFSVTFPPLLDKDIALTFAVLAPFFNPIIYSLRNKDMKDAIKKILCYQKMFNVSGSQWEFTHICSNNYIHKFKMLTNQFLKLLCMLYFYVAVWVWFPIF